MQPPPPSPLIQGSSTPNASEVATAASTALPPAREQLGADLGRPLMLGGDDAAARTDRNSCAPASVFGLIGMLSLRRPAAKPLHAVGRRHQLES